MDKWDSMKLKASAQKEIVNRIRKQLIKWEITFAHYNRTSDFMENCQNIKHPKPSHHSVNEWTNELNEM